jgi:solute carrier family 25 phosphate transporter 3
MVGGALACGLTHTAVVSLDIAKCNMQANPKEFTGLGQSIGKLYSTQGVGGVTKGWLPTFIGYHIQGLFKFGLNECFKDFYGGLVGEENAVKYRRFVWAAASGSAEFFADIGLCPFEMVKVRVQTDIKCPQGFGEAWKMMSENKAVTRFPFGSLVPLWSRQIPYTIAKFVGFEQCVEWFYKHVFTKDRKSYSKGFQLGVTFMSGYIAGVFCAIVSQPADNIVSQLAKAENRGKGFGDIAREVGMKNLFMKGLGTRILMVGTLTGLQWWIYDTWKVAMGFGTTGGLPAQKK